MENGAQSNERWKKSADIRSPSKERRNKRASDISAPRQLRAREKGADMNIKLNIPWN